MLLSFMKHFQLTKWILLSIFSASIFCSCGDDSDAGAIDEYATDTSIAVTGSSSAITPVSAEIVCKANISQGGSASFELGVLYSTKSEELDEFGGYRATTKNLVGNAYKITLSSLRPNTTYYYRSYVASAGINNYGKIKSFTTQSIASPITLQADTITAFSAYLHGKRELTTDYMYELGTSCSDGFVVSERKDSMERYGMFVFPNSSYSYYNYKAFSNGDYRIIVNNLQPQRVYYYKAITSVNGGYTYGAVKSFTTGEFEKPSVSTPTDITISSVNLMVITIDLSAYTVKTIGVDYATDARYLENGSYNSKNSNTNNGTQHPVSLSGLYPNTTYYVRPFVSLNVGNQIQKVYGETVTFMTADFPAPTSSVTEVTHNKVSITVNTPQVSMYKRMGVQYSLKKDDIGNGQIVYNSGYTSETSASIIISGLSEQTTYYYRPLYYALKDYYNNERYDYVYGDVKTFVTTEAPPRQTMTITTAGSYGWTTYNTTSYSNCLKSNNEGMSNSTARSILSFTVNNTSSLTFGYRVSSESGYDKMTIKVDNDIICNEISGNKSVTSINVPLEKGDHTITLAYMKNNSGNSYNDCGYIYNIAVNGEMMSNSDFK